MSLHLNKNQFDTLNPLSGKVSAGMECVKHITVFAIQFDMTNIWEKCVHTCSSRVGNDAYFTDEDSRKVLCQCSPSTNSQ